MKKKWIDYKNGSDWYSWLSWVSKVDSKVSTETDEISIPDVSDLVNKCIVKNMQKGINGVEVTQNGTRDNQNILKEYAKKKVCF